MMTMRVALRASSIVSAPWLSAAAGGAREEDDAIGVARDLVEGLDHPCLAPPPAGGGGHRGPHALVELATELVDEPLLLAGHAHVALGKKDLAVSRLHAQEPHGRDYGKGRAGTERFTRRVCAGRSDRLRLLSRARRRRARRRSRPRGR